MASKGDQHPDPNTPDEGPTPKFPPGAMPIKTVTPPQPGTVKPDPATPIPAREPFPDEAPTPGVGKH